MRCSYCGAPHECPRCNEPTSKVADVTQCEGCEQPAMTGASMCRDCWVDWYREDPFGDEEPQTKEETDG